MKKEKFPSVNQWRKGLEIIDGVPEDTYPFEYDNKTIRRLRNIYGEKVKRN